MSNDNRCEVQPCKPQACAIQSKLFYFTRFCINVSDRILKTAALMKTV